MHNWLGFPAGYQVIDRGRRPAAGVPGEPCPCWASTAQPDTRKSRQAAVTVSVLQPTTAAIVARVTATWRPVAWSACSAITDAIPSSVVVDIDTAPASGARCETG